jgi:hypothetical protein
MNPHQRPIEIAKELGITRSAVSQTYNNLVTKRLLSIRSNIDVGKLGFFHIIGWAKSGAMAGTIPKLSGWLASNPYVTSISESAISSSLDTRVVFEAILPPGQQHDWFMSQLDRFRKRPHSLEVETNHALSIADHLNIGAYDGEEWTMAGGFRFEASIDAARSYADVLPTVSALDLSKTSTFDKETALIAATMEDNYYIPSREVASYLEGHGYDKISERTIRRRLNMIREKVLKPYVHIQEINLDQRVILCLKEEKDGPLKRLLHAQATTFPKTRVITGENLTLVDIGLPAEADWFAMSNSLSMMAQPPTQFSTLLINRPSVRSSLSQVLKKSNMLE